MPETLIKDPKIPESWKKELQEKSKAPQKEFIKHPSHFISGINRVMGGLKKRIKDDPSDSAVRDLVNLLNTEFSELVSKAKKYEKNMPYPDSLAVKITDIAKKINDGGILYKAILDVFDENYRPVMEKKWASLADRIRALAKSLI